MVSRMKQPPNEWLGYTFIIVSNKFVEYPSICYIPIQFQHDAWN